MPMYQCRGIVQPASMEEQKARSRQNIGYKDKEICHGHCENIWIS